MMSRTGFSSPAKSTIKSPLRAESSTSVEFFDASEVDPSTGIAYSFIYF